MNNNFCQHIKQNIETGYTNFLQKTTKKGLNEKIFGKKHTTNRKLICTMKATNILLKSKYFVCTNEDKNFIK